MLVIGITGSLAMGKSTVAAMFGEIGAAVWNADAAVHALYSGAAAEPIGAAFPGTVREGKVDRAALGAQVTGNPAALAKLEAIVHPLVHAGENAFRARAAASGRRVLVLDIPLLFETGGERRTDAVVVVTASAEVQRQRIAGRGMDAARASALIARQMSDADKRLRAHFIVNTSGELEATRGQVRDVMRALAARAAG
jgi:dephospho-CoA kinase